ncbi:MAG: hypothetical protein U0326_18705 [Polyangiales bacterium]
MPVDARSSVDVVVDASADAARRLDVGPADAFRDAVSDVPDADVTRYEEPPADCACRVPGARGGGDETRALAALWSICALAASKRRPGRRAPHPRR